jgi:hypothetical protein
MHFKTFTAGVLAAGSLNAVLAAPMGRVHTPCASSTAVMDAIVSKLPLATQSQQATHTPCTTTTTHTPCSSSTTAAADALNVPRQAEDWAATPTVNPQQATPAVETAWLVPSAPIVASPPQQPTPALNTPVLAPSTPAATPFPPQATPTYTYEETHRPAPDSFGKIATIITLSFLASVVLLVLIWAFWSHRRGGKPFVCFGSCVGRNDRERKLDDESIAGAGRHYACSEEEAELMPVRKQQWPGRSRTSVRVSDYVPAASEHVPAPVIVEMEPLGHPEEMVYQARGQPSRPEPEWARGF